MNNTQYKETLLSASLIEFGFKDPLGRIEVSPQERRSKRNTTMTNENKSQTGNAPTRKYRSGAVQLTVWTNEGQNNDTFETFTFQRSYKDKNDNWQNTQTLRESDLPRIIALAQRAYADGIKTE